MERFVTIVIGATGFISAAVGVGMIILSGFYLVKGWKDDQPPISR